MAEPHPRGRLLSDAETSHLIATTLRQMADSPATLREIVADVLGSADHPAMDELTGRLREDLLKLAGPAVTHAPNSEIRIAVGAQPGDEAS